jgi:hypothetical protein
MKKAPVYSLLISACLLTAVAAKWSRLPSVDKVPVNMSSVLAGTTVSSSNGVSPSGALVLNDPMKAIKLASGRSDAVIKFVKQSVVKSASFVSDGLEGKVEVAMSADGKAWNSLATSVFSPADRVVQLDTGAAQGRYLRLQFELVRGGSIRSFKAIGSDTDANYTVKQSPDNSGPKVNLGGGAGGARLIYVSPELFGSRNDAVLTGDLSFPESDDKYRTAIYDLGQIRSLDEFGSVHANRPVRLTVYAFEVLPEKEDWRGRLAFDPAVFDTIEPVAVGEDRDGKGFVNVKPKKQVKSRYLALRWEPDFNPPGFSVSGISISGSGVVSYQSGDTVVETTTNSGGDSVSNIKSPDGNISITVDGAGNVSSGAGAPSAGGGQGGGGGGQEGGGSADAPIIGPAVMGAPSAQGAGTNGVSKNPRSKGKGK